MNENMNEETKVNDITEENIQNQSNVGNEENEEVKVESATEVTRKEDKIITATDFVAKCDKYTSDTIRMNYIQSMIKTDSYIPFEKKMVICKNIVESTHTVKVTDKNGNESRKLHMNSPLAYMMYCIALIDTYTNIHIDFKNMNVMSEFNILNQGSYLDLLFAYIPEKEAKEFKMVLDMTDDDFMQNEYETHAYLSSQVERFGTLAGLISSPILERIAEAIEGLDEKTVDKFVGKVSKFIKK